MKYNKNVDNFLFPPLFTTSQHVKIIEKILFPSKSLLIFKTSSRRLEDMS